MGPGTYFTKIVQVNSDGTLATVVATSELTGDEMNGAFQGTITDSTGKTVFARFSGTGRL
jgi:hypothetical protein